VFALFLVIGFDCCIVLGWPAWYRLFSFYFIGGRWIVFIKEAFLIWFVLRFICYGFGLLVLVGVKMGTW